MPLGAVNLLVLPVVVGCTSLVTALGVTALAAHTIVKQVWFRVQQVWLGLSGFVVIPQTTSPSLAMSSGGMAVQRARGCSSDITRGIRGSVTGA